MPFRDRSSVLELALGGSLAVAASAGVASGIGPALAVGGAALLVGVLSSAFLGIVLLGIFSPLVPLTWTLPGGTTQLYWPELVAPALLPGIGIALLARRPGLLPLDWTVMLFAGTAYVSLATHPISQDAFYGAGIFGLVAIAYLAPALRSVTACTAKRFMTLLWWAGLLEAGLVTGSFLLSGSPLFRYTPHLATLAHGFLASFLVVTIAIGATRLALPTAAARFMALAGLITAGFGLVIVSSRAGVVGAIVAFVVTASLIRPRWLVLPGILTGLGLAFIPACGLDLKDGLEQLFYISSAAEVEESLTRLYLAQEAWTLFLGNMAFGVGPGNYGNWSTFVNYLGQPIASVHNNYLQVAVETGIAGIILFIFTLALGFRTAARLACRPTWDSDRLLGAAAAGSLAGLAVQSLAGDFLVPALANDGLNGARSAVVVWTLLGMAAARARLRLGWQGGVSSSMGHADCQDLDAGKT